MLLLGHFLTGSAETGFSCLLAEHPPTPTSSVQILVLGLCLYSHPWQLLLIASRYPVYIPDESYSPTSLQAPLSLAQNFLVLNFESFEWNSLDVCPCGQQKTLLKATSYPVGKCTIRMCLMHLIVQLTAALL